MFYVEHVSTCLTCLTESLLKDILIVCAYIAAVLFAWGLPVQLT